MVVVNVNLMEVRLAVVVVVIDVDWVEQFRH
jgi:hypothetical protein